MHVLWISPYAPYDTVGHAGGKNHNYYLKYIKKNTNYDITLISICVKSEIANLDLDRYGIDYIIMTYNRWTPISLIEDVFGLVKIKRDGGLLGNRKYHLLLSALKQYVESGKKPDVIITQWTDATLIYDTLKELFPDSKYIAIEEDVAFLGYKRKYENSNGLFRAYNKKRYDFLKLAEIRTLSNYDLVVALNDQDRDLLISEGIQSKSVLRMSSYHELFKENVYQPDLHKLLFYGAMSRPENYKSAIWFIENVMSKLDDRYSLVVVGSNPSEELIKLKSNRVTITGFVSSVAPYFEQSLCLVAPLLLGAGTKIKVLEALSAGLPVLTNDIGAEGISLTNGDNYLHCESADDYVNAIKDLTSNEELRNKISHNGRAHVMMHFDADASLDMLIGRLKEYEQ